MRTLSIRTFRLLIKRLLLCEFFVLFKMEFTMFYFFTFNGIEYGKRGNNNKDRMGETMAISACQNVQEDICIDQNGLKAMKWACRSKTDVK